MCSDIASHFFPKLKREKFKIRKMSGKEGTKKKAAKAPKKESKQGEEDDKGKLKEATKTVAEGKAKAAKKGPVSNSTSKKSTKK